MRLSMNLMEAESDIQVSDLQKLNEYSDNKNEPTQISKFIQRIIINGKTYSVYRIAKKVNKTRSKYSVNENGIIMPSEEEYLDWDTRHLYIMENGKSVYVSGSTSGWVLNTISQIMFQDETKIKTIKIDTSKIEEDIRNNARFTALGTSFIDNDGTKITIQNKAGVDLNTNYVTTAKGSVNKDHIDIVIEKDDLKFGVYVYPEGKVTFYAYTKLPENTLKIFLKLWSEIKEYS